MNRIAKSALFACALAALAVKPTLAQEEAKDYPGAPDPTSYGYTVLAIGIGTPFALPWGFDWDVFGLDLNFVYGDCNKMYGLELAGVANTARLDMLGLQASLACNFANRDAIGAQIGLVNVCDSGAGLQLGLWNQARTFAGVEHRIQLVRTLRGVRYYNDSIASSPSRTTAGLRSFEQQVILIAGGHDKHIPFDGLGREIVEHVKALFLVGETAEAIRAAVLAAPGYDPDKLPVTVLDDFKETVLAASAYAKEGDVVILSPACSSFDRFKNFVERGNTFRRIVEELE